MCVLMRRYIRPQKWRWALEPVIVCLSINTIALLLPQAFPCVRADCMDHHADGCERVGPTHGGFEYGCPAGYYNQAATLMLRDGADTIKVTDCVDDLPLLLLLSLVAIAKRLFFVRGFS